MQNNKIQSPNHLWKMCYFKKIKLNAHTIDLILQASLLSLI